MLKKLHVFIAGESAGWRMWEIVYVIACTAAIGVISCILGESLLGIASAVTGTLYTMLAGKGKISCYYFGIFNSAAYGYIAFGQKLYGDAVLNWFWYLPMMFAGIAFWRKRMNQEHCVVKKFLKRFELLILIAFCGIGIVFFAWVLSRCGDRQPVVDASTTVLSIAAMILTVRRCVEQWLLWIMVNGISVFMWLRVYLDGGNSIATLLWWLIMLVTGVIFFCQWLLELRRSNTVN